MKRTKNKISKRPLLPRERGEYSAIVDRPALKLPGGARLIFWTIINLEVWDIGKPMARQVLAPPTGITHLPDVPNWSWHEYGMRVGVWRFFDLFKRQKIQPTLAINARVCDDYTRVAQEAKNDGWEFMGHPYQQGPIHQESNQKAMIKHSLDVIKSFTGKRPIGWLGPGLTQTLETPDLLTAAGIKYIGDWVYDDEPTTIRTANGPLVTLPYTLELNDIPMMAVQHHEADYLTKRTIDQFDRLYAEGEKRAKILALAVHPYLSGQPHRIKYLEAIYDYARRFDGVLYWTGEEIFHWYHKCVGAKAIGTSLLFVALCCAVAANAAPCRSGGPYDKWLSEFEREAVAQGISQQTIAAAAPFLTYDQRIVGIDRGQRVFTQTFLEFSDRMAAAYRIQRGGALIKTYAPVFARIDKEFGVPAPVIVSFWALESDFGANMGNYRTLSAIASLAYDCRRADRFRAELLDALRLIQRGDLHPGDMSGSWAGELGQTQMMPSEYFRYAVDYDGDGARNLLRSAPDVLGSTANYLVGLGWRRGEPWLTEVRVPANMPWQQADLDVKLPRAKWAAYGVTLADGKALPADDLNASLLLPMGRFGPAFLGYENFRVYLQWNNALVYSTTAAYLATRIAGAPPLHRGNPPAPLLLTTSRRCKPCWFVPVMMSGQSMGSSD